MTITDLLRKAADAGVFLSYEQDVLRYKLTSEAFPRQLREEILARRDGLIDFFREHDSGVLASQASEVIPSCDRSQQTFPTSFPQQRLWFVDQLLGGSAQYNMPVALRVEGRFDESCAERALQRLIERHEPLRTVFLPGSGGPLQQLEDAQDFRLECIDLRSCDAGEQVERIEHSIADEAARRFDLSADLMLRGVFLRRSDDEGVLLLTLHHIAVDGWSLGIIAREFVELYEAEWSGTGHSLPPLPIQYIDYSVWQQRQLESESLQRQWSYWQEQLREVPQLHELPTDRPRPQRQRFRGAKVQARVEAPVIAELKSLAQANGATLYMVLHAALTVVLARMSGSRDIVIGTPVANRRQAQLDGLVGFFVNMLVLRSRIASDPRFVDYLGEIRSLHLQAQANQEVPFEYLVEHLNPDRSLSHAALVQIVLSLDLAELPILHVPGATLTAVPGNRVTAKFDLLMAAREKAGGLEIELEYDTDLFEPHTAERLTRCLVTVLSSIVEDPGRRFFDLQLLWADESERVIHHFNATTVSYPPAVCVHELFEAQVERTPEAIALTFEGRSMTYRELNARSNQLAHYLSARGVKPETCVAICAQRSLEMVVGIMGTLKAGGAYVPLDPTYPADRLAYMMADSAPALVLSCGEIQDGLLPAHVECVRLDAESVPFAACSSENPSIGVRPEHLAYVIYTSGSTGQPKGVMNQHDAVVNGLRWGLAAYPLSGADAVVQKTPFSFDVSVWEFMLPLLSGARLVLARPEGHRDPEYLAGLIERERITLVHFVPSMLQAFIEQGVSERCQGVRRILCSGEALSPALQRRCQASFPQAELHNLYGPTEAAVHATAWPCRLDRHAGIVPIGRPLANTQAYILDERRQPVPIGAVGELYLGGAGVARGYLNRAELTQARFIRDPFGSEAGARLYQTGDLCRWLADGNIQYLGRNDFQVKIRGLRIELGEIEQQLLSVPDVQSAVVVAHDDDAGQRALVAYVTLHEQADGGVQLPETLRRQVALSLPEYMVPTAIIVLEAIPLTINGKVDKKALPAPDWTAHMEAYVAPRTDIEAAICQIWQDVLGMKIGVRDNFFNIGGHSIKAMRATAMLRKHFALADEDLPLTLLFEQQTVESLSSLVAVRLQLDGLKKNLEALEGDAAAAEEDYI